jgi:hypothetical protein
MLSQINILSELMQKFSFYYETLIFYLPMMATLPFPFSLAILNFTQQLILRNILVYLRNSTLNGNWGKVHRYSTDHEVASLQRYLMLFTRVQFHAF